MHQTLYRKYRPKNLDEVCGQEVIVTILKNQFQTDSTAHAYLFSGPRGTGKTSVAKIFARTLNCEGEKKPCEECIMCKQKQGDTLDIIEIDAASNNGVDEIRELKSKINLTPTSGKYKIYIIDEVHMLTPSAFNALLKTLEEPPLYATFILATTEPHKVPETILSRCQRFDFKRISDNAIIERLKQIKEKENISVEEEALKEIARISFGGMRDAISLLEQTHAYSPTLITTSDVHKINGSLTEKELVELLKEMFDGDLEKILLKVEKYYNDGKNMVKVMEEIINFLRKMLIKQHGNEKQTKEIVELFQKQQTTNFLEKLMLLNKFLYDMRQDPNPKTLLEIALIDFAEKNEQTPAAPVAKVVEKKVTKPDIDVSFEIIKRMRIDNTFVKVSKQFKRELVQLIKNKKTSLAKINGVGSLLIDGEIVAASSEHQYFIMLFSSQACADMYNQNLDKIDKIIENELKMKIKSIAVNDEEWHFYREEFKAKKRKYEYVEENGEVEQSAKESQQNEIELNFPGLIESK